MIDIVLSDGRRHLYQWDVDQYVRIAGAPPGAQAHFALAGQDTAVCCNINDGLAAIPNVLLQSNKSIMCYVYDENHTAYYTHIKVIARPRPCEYVYTPTEVRSWAQLDARIKSLENSSAGALAAGDGIKIVDGIISIDTQSINIDGGIV